MFSDTKNMFWERFGFLLKNFIYEDQCAFSKWRICSDVLENNISERYWSFFFLMKKPSFIKIENHKVKECAKRCQKIRSVKKIWRV